MLSKPVVILLGIALQKRSTNTTAGVASTFPLEVPMATYPPNTFWQA